MILLHITDIEMWAITLTTLLLLVLIRLARAQGTDVIYFEPPSLPKISSVVTSGNGCPANSTSVLTPSNTKNFNWNDWRFTFHKFLAQDTRNITARERNTNCQIHISITTGPLGWQTAVKALTVRSNAFLSPGSELVATATSAVFLVAESEGGNIPRVTRNVTFLNDRREAQAGPVTVRFDFGQGPWSSCMTETANAGVINVNFRVSVKKSVTDGVASYGAAVDERGQIDSNGTAFVTEQLEWLWRRCNVSQSLPSARTSSRPSTPSGPGSPTMDRPIDDGFELLDPETEEASVPQATASPTSHPAA